MALPDITFAIGNPADNISPIERWYEDEKGHTQFRAIRKILCTSPATAIPDVVAEGSWYGAPLRDAVAQGRGQNNAQAVVTATYDTKGIQKVNGTYIDESMAPRQIWIAAPTKGKLEWADGKRVTDTHGYDLLAWTYILHNARMLACPSVPLNYIGSCNASGKACSLLSYTFGIGYVLFGAPTVSAHAEMGNGTRYSAVYQHGIHPYSWNSWYHVENAAWEPLYHPNGDRYYQYPLIW